MHSGELARQRTHTLDESLLVDPEESDRPVADFLGSTPGRMALVAVVLIAALLAVGVGVDDGDYGGRGVAERLGEPGGAGTVRRR